MRIDNMETALLTDELDLLYEYWIGWVIAGNTRYWAISKPSSELAAMNGCDLGSDWLPKQHAEPDDLIKGLTLPP